MNIDNVIEWLKSIYHEHKVNLDGRRKEIETAISSLEELKRWRTDQINDKIKNPFAWTSTLICHNCDHKDEYIEELEFELDEYQAIGTVEECREARAKQIPNKPIEPQEDYGTFQCPSCGGLIYTTDEFETHKFCLMCGQAIDWGD